MHVLLVYDIDTDWVRYSPTPLIQVQMRNRSYYLYIMCLFNTLLAFLFLTALSLTLTYPDCQRSFLDKFAKRNVE